MKQSISRWLILCVLMMACSAAALAQPLPVPAAPRADVENLLKNSGFENGQNNWTLTAASAKDKVKCGDSGYLTPCAFQFKGSSASEATVINQVYVPQSAGAKVAIVMYGEAIARSLSGTSCLRFTLKIQFKNGNQPIKGSQEVCGSGAAQDWQFIETFGELTSFTEKQLAKATVTIRHSGVGLWLVDNVNLYSEDK